jgi:hypothetical protein
MGPGIQSGNDLLSGSVVIDVTYAELIATIAVAGLLPGAWYHVTDATAANGGFGSVYIQAITTDTLAEDNAYWQFDTNLKAFGWLDLGGTMAVGDNLASISVNGVNQLTGGGVFFATTYAALATAAAANINANAAATVTAATVKERLILTAKSAGIAPNGQAIAGAGTNFVSSNISDMSDGEAVQTLFLPVYYEVTSNQVLTVFQPDIDFTFEVDSAYITTTTYNPLYYFRWGSTSFLGASPFLNAQFYNKNLRFLYFKNTSFQKSILYSDFSITTGAGGVVNFLFANNITASGGTLNLTNTLFNYTLIGQGLNLSNAIIRTGTTVNLSNSYLGGTRITLITYAGGTTINLSNSTITPGGSSTLEGFSNSNITITGVTITSTLDIRAGERSTITASATINYTCIIQDTTGFSNTINISTLQATNSFTLNTRFSTLATINFSAAVCTNLVNISGNLSNSTINMSGCTFASYSATSLLMDNFSISGGAQNFGANNIIFTGARLATNTINIPALTSNFDMTNLVFVDTYYKIQTQVNNFDGTAGRGLVNTDVLFMRVPNKFVLSNFTAEFAGLVGVGCLLQAEIAGGTAAGIMVATAIGTLNNTVQGPGSAIVPPISGATGNYKVGIAWDNIAIVPTVANLTAGNIVICVEGFISQI